MKIGSDNLLANYTLARQSSSKREDFTGSSGESGVTRTSAPTVAPSLPQQTSAFARALWTIGADKCETTSADTGIVDEFMELAKIACDLTPQVRAAQALRDAHADLESRVKERTRELAAESQSHQEALQHVVNLLRKVLTAQEDGRQAVRASEKNEPQRHREGRERPPYSVSSLCFLCVSVSLWFVSSSPSKAITPDAASIRREVTEGQKD